MDANQIRLFIQTNIEQPEPGTRLALELQHFTEAIIGQERALTPDQIGRAWERWQLERIHYVNHVKTYSVENAKKLQDLAAQRVMDTEPDLNKDPQLAHEAHLFKQAYAKQLKHLSQQPLAEHIDRAWEAWKKGFRW
jgi:hypothetical protein